MKKLEQPNDRSAIQVNVAKLKNELSAYLAMAKEGRQIVVTEHKVPVARVIPIEEGPEGDWAVQPARKPLSTLKKLSLRKGTSSIDSLAGLLKERARR